MARDFTFMVAGIFLGVAGTLGMIGYLFRGMRW